jgi:hypothetical protein
LSCCCSIIEFIYTQEEFIKACVDDSPATTYRRMLSLLVELGVFTPTIQDVCFRLQFLMGKEAICLENKSKKATMMHEEAKAEQAVKREVERQEKKLRQEYLAAHSILYQKLLADVSI